MKEEWKQIAGCKPGYEVSDNGRVRSPSKILKTPKNRYGYKCVSIRSNGKITFPTIHKLVALTFIGPRPMDMETAHMDGDKDNNHVSNLAYVSQEENHKHMILHGTRARGDKHGQSKLTSSQVEYILFNTKLRSPNNSIRAMARKFDVDPATIRRIINGVNWGDLRRAKATLDSLT